MLKRLFYILMFLGAAQFAFAQANGIQDLSAAKKKPISPSYVRADFSKTLGKIRPLNGVNNSPKVLNGEIPAFREVGIPFVRLHDTDHAYGGTYFVDVPNIFPDFDADENDPKNYDFAMTDAYLKTLDASGCKIFYRLGVTIENTWKVKAYRIFPPKDMQKWARICANIVRHYNEGWADGMKLGIEYWEIWNEPENPPMWQGSKEQYFELYRTAAKLLKKEFPNIKVGGYASCGFYSITRQTGDFYKSFIVWFEDFLKYVCNPDTSAPLDFFSWHLYTDNPLEIAAHADFVRKSLDSAGLQKTESIFDEWNYSKFASKRQNHEGAAFVAAAFCVLQNAPVDKAMYYDATPSRTYCGIFDYPDAKPAKVYFAFKAFDKLAKLGTQVWSESSFDTGIYSLAAVGKSGGEKGIMVANFSNEMRNVSLDLAGAEVMQCFVTDDAYSFTELNFSLIRKNVLKMRPYSVVYLIVK